MSKIKYAMRETGLRYFSSLTAKQKDKSILYTSGFIAEDFNSVLLPIYRQIYNPDLTGCKMMYMSNFKVWLPVNISDFKA